MYSLRDYGKMIRDEVRTRSYVEALRRTVRPDSVVVDIGTGPGILAMTACRFGARRVYAIEPDDVIELAREIAADNGFGERIEFIQAISTEVELPERADVVVAEIHGVLPLFGRSLATLIDARERFLAPSGAMVPFRETVHAAVIGNEALYASVAGPWAQNTHGLDLRRGRAHLTSDIYRVELSPADLMSAPRRWTELDYLRITRVDVEDSLLFTAEKAGLAHGVGLWFESSLAGEVAMSTQPGGTPLIFGNLLLPWPAAVELETGDEIQVRIRAKLMEDRYIWQWETRVSSGGVERAHFAQSQFDMEIIVPEKLRRQGAHHVPGLNREGEMHRAALDGMAGGRSLGEIAAAMQREYPGRFARWDDALKWVAGVSARCSD